MKKYLLNIVVLIVAAAFMLVAAEGLFRFDPSLIGISVVDRMHPELRSRIAKQLELPTTDDYVVIPSAERADHGPDIFLTKPNWTYFRPADEADREVGAVDTTTTDFRGFCNPPSIATIKSFDIVTVGGSVPNCAVVEGSNVFSNQLGQMLSTPSYNLAVHAVGPYEYNEVIQRFYYELTPRLVIYAISEANDLRDSLRYLEFFKGEYHDKRSKLGGLFRVSYVLAFIKAGFEVVYKNFTAGFASNFRYSIMVQGSTVEMNITNGDLDELKNAKKLVGQQIQVDLYAAPLKTFVEFAKQKRFIPLVMYVPTAYTVYQKRLEFEDPSIAHIMRDYSQKQRDWLATNSKHIGYEFIDPTNALQERAVYDQLLYFPSDLHLTPAGHRALAVAVAPTVARFLRH